MPNTPKNKKKTAADDSIDAWAALLIITILTLGVYYWLSNS
jgi:hypothetical protein